MPDITNEVNFYKKNVLKLNEHYRVKRISEYMKEDNESEHKLIGLPEAYYCLNACNNYTKLIRENEANDLIVGEGLIKTYPADKALSIVKKFLKDNLSKELYELKMSETELVKIHDMRVVDLKDEDYADEHNPLSKMSFIFPFYKDNDLKAFIGKLADKLYVCGYNYANKNTYSVAVQPFEKKKIVLVSLLFEAKYHEEDFVFAKNLYHVTTLSMLSKIKHKGLVPKSKSDKFDYPERVYLFNNATPNVILDYIETKLAGKDDVAIVLKIDSTKFQDSNAYKNGKMKLYIDHMFDDISRPANALFTYSTIDPKLIENDILVVNVENRRITSMKSRKLTEMKGN